MEIKKYELCEDCEDLHKLYWCSQCIMAYFTWFRAKQEASLMKDHERRTRANIAKVVKNIEDLPLYFKEQARYYRRNRLVRDLDLAGDVIHMLQEQVKELQDAQ